MTRADSFTFLKKKPVYFTDFVDSFDLNPQTGLLEVVNNEQSVIQSIKNLVFTNIFERPYQPALGSKVQSLAFEMNDPLTADLLKQTLFYTISTFEPRVNNLNIIVNPLSDDNQITITIIFNLRNLTTPISFDLTLPRVR